MAGVGSRIDHALSRVFPERRLFLRSDSETRYVRLAPATQFLALSGSVVLVGWSIIATSIILMDSIGSGSSRDQALREKIIYEERLDQLSKDRDHRAEEAERVQRRFLAALDQISEMQTTLLEAEDRRKELEDGIEVIQATLRRTIEQRDAARKEATELAARVEGMGTDEDPAVRLAHYEATLDALSNTLAAVAVSRDEAAEAAEIAESETQQLILEAKIVAERNDRIFQQLEDAVSVSVKPLDNVFKKAGLSPDKVLSTIRKGYSGQGGPLMPISLSTKGSIDDGVARRANDILDRLDEINLYRVALQKMPLGFPVKGAVRYSSGFGARWGRKHEGTDLAGAMGTPILATADGTVIHAGWQSGYGNLVKIQHELGIETRYGHMSKIRVKVGDRVSRGDRIGDMGSTGRSTGVHLHYEVRIDGKAVNPVSYLKAEQDVF